MSYKIGSNCIIRLDDGACIPIDPSNTDYQAYETWCSEGNAPIPIPPATVQEIVAEFLPQLQGWIDSIAQQNNYDSALSCISYANSTNAQWAGDAAAMIKYRDALWAWAYAQQITLNAMTPEQLSALTAASIIAQAPKAADSGWIIHPSPA